MYHPTLRLSAQHQLKKIGRADLVIGLPTYKNAKSAAHVAQIALEGLKQHYPDLSTALINADAGLKAATRQAVKAQTPQNGSNLSVVTGRYDGTLGQGNAVASLLDAALALDAKAILILDSNTQTITPDWIAGLAHLILENKADLVLPRYQWSFTSPASGLSDLIAYPLFRALWGRSLRHPAAPDFALSSKLAIAVLDADIWETEAAVSGFSPWLATYSVLGNWRVAQAALGEKCTHPLRKRSKQSQKVTRQFKTYFHDVVSVMFRQLYLHEDKWRDVEAFYSLSTLTEFASKTKVYTPHEQNPTALLDELALGWIEYRMLWQTILTSENLRQLESLAALPPDQFYFPSDLWGRVLYDFAVVFNKGDCDPYQLVYSLFPIYRARLAAFWQEIAGLSLVGSEGTVAAQAVELEELRSYLKVRWHTYQPRNRN